MLVCLHDTAVSLVVPSPATRARAKERSWGRWGHCALACRCVAVSLLARVLLGGRLKVAWNVKDVHLLHMFVPYFREHGLAAKGTTLQPYDGQARA